MISPLNNSLMKHNIFDFFSSLKLFISSKEFYNCFQQKIINEHFFSAAELVQACIVEKNLVGIVAFWKNCVHGLFSDRQTSKNLNIFNNNLTKLELKCLVQATRMQISSEFAVLIKTASKSCIGKAKNRMSSVVPIKKSSLSSILKVKIGNPERNLDGFETEPSKDFSYSLFGC